MFSFRLFLRTEEIAALRIVSFASFCAVLFQLFQLSSFLFHILSRFLDPCLSFFHTVARLHSSVMHFDNIIEFDVHIANGFCVEKPYGAICHYVMPLECPK